MQYQRLHIRVPATGDALLRVGDQVRIAASVINISAGGICITAPSHVLEDNEYHIEILTKEEGKIQFSGFPVYQTDTSVGIKITSIDKEDLKAIYRLVEGFQLTEEFIKHIDEHDILKDWLVDDAGNDLSVTFDTGTSKDE
ncbi:MAG: PilZ domain-containing protein [Desulfofustis sp.]|jgi:hypothetical protein